MRWGQDRQKLSAARKAQIPFRRGRESKKLSSGGSRNQIWHVEFVSRINKSISVSSWGNGWGQEEGGGGLLTGEDLCARLSCLKQKQGWNCDPRSHEWALKTYFTQCQHLKPPFQLPPCPENIFHPVPTPQTPLLTAPMPSKHV